MTFKRVTSALAGDTTHFGGLDVNKFSDYLGGTDISSTETVDVATPTKFRDLKLRIRNPANSFEYTIAASALTGDRTLTLPNLSANDTFSTLALAQTYTAGRTFDSFIEQKTQTAPANPASTYVRIYPKAIDANNDGWFAKTKENGSIVEVRIF